jgi:hypothetical protein
MPREKKEDKPAMPLLNKMIRLFLKWLPRIAVFFLAISAWFLVGIGAHGRPEVEWWKLVLPILIPLVISLRFKRIGGTIYMVFGLLLSFLFGRELAVPIAIPFIIVGLLFWADALSEPSRTYNETSSIQT